MRRAPMRLRACTAGLTAIALLALPSLAPGATGEKDYSKNAATGDNVSPRAEAEAALRKRSEALDRALQQGRLYPGYGTATNSAPQATRRPARAASRGVTRPSAPGSRWHWLRRSRACWSCATASRPGAPNRCAPTARKADASRAREIGACGWIYPRRPSGNCVVQPKRAPLRRSYGQNHKEEKIMRSTRNRGCLAALLAIAAFAAPAGAAASQPPESSEGGDVAAFASGLTNPRHVRFGPDGQLYVAEAGVGGDQPATTLSAGGQPVHAGRSLPRRVQRPHLPDPS